MTLLTPKHIGYTSAEFT